MVNNGWYMLILAMNEDKLTVCYKQWPIQSWFTDESSDFQHSYISLPEGKPLHPLSKWCNQQDNTWQYQNPPARNRRKSKHLKAHPEKNKKLISEVPACQSENLRKAVAMAMAFISFTSFRGHGHRLVLDQHLQQHRTSQIHPKISSRSQLAAMMLLLLIALFMI